MPQVRTSMSIRSEQLQKLTYGQRLDKLQTHMNKRQPNHSRPKTNQEVFSRLPRLLRPKISQEVSLDSGDSVKTLKSERFNILVNTSENLREFANKNEFH